ncbi:MAG: hypothetical protein HY961_09900 [Ignavibacteriae bacterium]|nr:hypothetical protein [Ignavibacteriota bacterium]
MTTHEHTASRIVLPILCTFLFITCNIFEPREAEPPTQSGYQYQPRTFPANVIFNLQNAIREKDPVGYIACFSDSTRNQAPYVFVPSADAANLYGAVLRNWTYQQELSYFQNLISKTRQPQGFSFLSLTPKDSSGTTSRIYGFDYVLTFEHTDTAFTQTARGSLQFTLTETNSEWTISRWVDLKTEPELTWSSFKGRFSN